MPRAHVELTAVVYDEGDALGLVLAFASLAPQAVVIAQAAALLAAETPRRRVALARLLAGQLLNQALSIALKHVFRSGRPSSSARIDYGMPSSHAQFVAYLVVLASCMLGGAARSPGCAWRDALTRFAARALMVFSFVLALAVCMSRVYLGYHDYAQVLVGCVFGAVFGTLWVSFPFARLWRRLRLDALTSFLDNHDSKSD